jgi:peptide-methionine (S)-S-oxide reductase
VAPLLLFLVLGAGLPAAGWAKAAQPAAADLPKRAVATFAMGCFWCAEAAYEGHTGVISVKSGFAGSHVEAVEVVYNPRKVTYEQLLDVFWHNVDPFDGGGQFCDRGEQYRSAIFVHDDPQRRAAEASKQGVAAKLGKAVATEVLDAGQFLLAAGSHQDYAAKTPVRYRFYVTGCGRAARLKQVWGEEAGGQH